MRVALFTTFVFSYYIAQTTGLPLSKPAFNTVARSGASLVDVDVNIPAVGVASLKLTGPAAGSGGASTNGCRWHCI